ncbi:MAG: hypothetical protein RIQ81_154 [Pseudomonadota bacterium]
MIYGSCEFMNKARSIMECDLKQLILSPPNFTAVDLLVQSMNKKNQLNGEQRRSFERWVSDLKSSCKSVKLHQEKIKKEGGHDAESEVLRRVCGDSSSMDFIDRYFSEIIELEKTTCQVRDHRFKIRLKKDGTRWVSLDPRPDSTVCGSTKKIVLEERDGVIAKMIQTRTSVENQACKEKMPDLGKAVVFSNEHDGKFELGPCKWLHLAI